MTAQPATTAPQASGLALLVALPLLAIVLARAPYLHDFAEWLYQARILADLALGRPAAAGFTIAPYPVPNSLATVLLAGLSVALPTLWAGKVFLCAMLLGWYGVVRAFCARWVQPAERSSAALLLYCLAGLAPFFWHGFISYQLGLLLLTAFLASYREHTPPVRVALFGLGLFFAHAAAFLVFVAFMGVRLWQTRSRAITAALLPAIGCALWFVAGRFQSPSTAPPADASWANLTEALLYKGGYPAMLGPFRNFILPGGTSLLENQPWLYWSGLAANFAIAAALGLLVAGVLWRHRRQVWRAGDGSAGVAAAAAPCMAILVLAYVFGPYHFFGLINPGGRLLVPLVLMAFMAGGPPARLAARRLAWPVTLFSLLTAAAYLYLMVQTRDPAFSPRIQAAAPSTAQRSVFAFNERLYRDTRFKYFNFRIFAFAQRFDQIESGQYHGVAFETGLLRGPEQVAARDH